MVIYLGADHKGFELKEHIKVFLQGKGYEVVDLGANELQEDDDYPDYASKVAQKVSGAHETSRGIVICGSGAGVDIVANKFPHVRSVLGISPDQIFDARNDDDVNVLALASGYTKTEVAEKIVMTWVETSFSGGERHRRRLEKIV